MCVCVCVYIYITTELINTRINMFGQVLTISECEQSSIKLRSFDWKYQGLYLES